MATGLHIYTESEFLVAAVGLHISFDIFKSCRLGCALSLTAKGGCCYISAERETGDNAMKVLDS